MPSLSTWWHTVRHLKPVQVYGRLWFRVSRPRLKSTASPSVRQGVCNRWNVPPARPTSMVGPTRFEFLNAVHDIGSAGGWNDPRMSKLWLYNLHYFDDLNATGADQRTDWHQALIRRWINENPPGLGNGWEPYPTSLRMVNWIKWLLRGGESGQDLLDSLAGQARWLGKRLEHHLLGNHLLANAKALVFAGLFFDGDEAERWYRKGISLLSRELREQVLSDGGHFERSPMYHLIILEDLLDVINIHRAFQVAHPAAWSEAALGMLSWSRAMRHPDGDIPLFNDAALDIALVPSVLDNYAAQLAIGPGRECGGGMVGLQPSGYGRLQKGSAVLFVDMAPVGPDYLPGHAHADTLSFELSVGLQRVIVNGGTSEYGHSPERHRQRSTEAHATVVIDRENSSEVWGGFRVGRRANLLHDRIWDEGDCLCASGAHDGYRHLPGKPVHDREWRLRQGRLEISDQITGKGSHLVEVVFPLAPGLIPALLPDGRICIREELGGSEAAIVEFAADNPVDIEQCTYHSRFGVAMPSWRIRLSIKTMLPMMHKTTITWNDLQ